jgi:hypothetical protein
MNNPTPTPMVTKPLSTDASLENTNTTSLENTNTTSLENTNTTSLVNPNTTTPEQKRLPRFKRTQREVAFLLTKRDLEILKIVQDFRLLTSAHIQALADGSNQGILRRLQKLFHAGHLDRLSPRPKYGEGSAKLVYAITNKGVSVLQKEGLIEEPSQTDRNYQNRNLHDLSVPHRLLISHIRATLTAACKTHPERRLFVWREGPTTQDAIEVALSDGYTRIPVAPDAFFGIEDTKGRTYYFLEADRGTMTVKRYHLKLKAYDAYWRARKHEDKFGIKQFRVLSVTQSAERQKHLAGVVAGDSDLREHARIFLFTNEPQLSLNRPASIFEPIWTIAGPREQIALIK